MTLRSGAVSVIAIVVVLAYFLLVARLREAGLDI